MEEPELEETLIGHYARPSTTPTHVETAFKKRLSCLSRGHERHTKAYQQTDKMIERETYRGFILSYPVYYTDTPYWCHSQAVVIRKNY